MQLRTILLGTFALALLAVVAGALTSQRSDTATAAFPGANGKIVFSQIGANELDVAIYTREANGAFPTPLTSPPDDYDDYNPAWSPDATMVAYERKPAGSLSEIRIVNADGTGDHAVPNTSGGRRPSWSPDGTQFVFDSGGDIFKINTDGTGLLNLTSSLGESFEADWSPTGDSIVFKQEVGDDGLIYTMDPDGTNVFQVTPPDDMLSGNPDWSPDGTRIVFDTNDRDFNIGDVIVIDADGGNRTNLTDDTEEDSGNPSWSPNGQHIVYEVQAPLALASDAVPAGIPPLQLFVMNTDGSNRQNLTQDALLYEFDPDWGVGPATPTPTASPTPEPTDTPPPGDPHLWGDNDCNGSIGARDNQALLRNVLSQTALSQTEPCPDIGSSIGVTVPAGGQQRAWGDLDCNGSISARDNQALLRHVLSQGALSQTEPCPDIGTQVLASEGG